jgi:hypothetical protein
MCVGTFGLTGEGMVSHEEAFQRQQQSIIREASWMWLDVIPPDRRPAITTDGRFFVSSVVSYDDPGKNIQHCSLVARMNLMSLLGAFDQFDAKIVARGDAVDLIQKWRKLESLKGFSDPGDMIEYLNVRYDLYGETIFDAYRHYPRRSHYYQWHRVALFLWDDNEWYVMDPLDGKQTIVPQKLSEYLPEDFKRFTWYVRKTGFALLRTNSYDRLSQVLPFLSPEIQLSLVGDVVYL